MLIQTGGVAGVCFQRIHPEKIYTSIVTSISNTEFRDTPRLNTLQFAISRLRSGIPVDNPVSKAFLEVGRIWFMASLFSSWSL